MPKITKKNSYLAIASLIFLTLVWGYNWIVMKAVSTYIGAFAFSALRCSFGAVLLFCLLFVRGRGAKMPPLLSTLGIGILQTAGLTGFSQWALVSGGAGKTAVLVYTMPFWVMLLAALFLNERLRLWQYIALLVAAVGLFFVIQPWSGSGTLFSSILALLSGVSWAVSVLIAKRLYIKHPQIDLLSLTAWQMLFGSILLCFIAFIVNEQSINWTVYLYLALVFNALISTAICWSLWLFVLRNLPASFAGISALAVPVCGVFFSWLCLREVPNIFELYGIVLIVIALAVISFIQLKNSHT